MFLLFGERSKIVICLASQIFYQQRFVDRLCPKKLKSLKTHNYLPPYFSSQNVSDFKPTGFVDISTITVGIKDLSCNEVKPHQERFCDL